MGITTVTTTVCNLARDKAPYEAQFMVDTGAIDCLVPEDALQVADIQVEGKDVYELANGTLVEYDYGYAIVNFMGAETVTKIIFGPKNSEPLLGVVALESTGYGVDPITKTLRKMGAKPLK